MRQRQPAEEYNTTRYINYLLVAYAFVTPVSRAGIVFFTALMLLVWFTDKRFGTRSEQLKQNRFILILTLFILYNFISLLWSDAIPEGLQYIKRYWYLSVIPVIYTSVQKRYIPYMVSAFLLGMLISEIISYGIFFEWWHFKNVPPQMPTPFMHHIHYSLFLAFTALLLLNRIFQIENLRWKIAYIFYFCFVTINLFVNGGRTGQLAFIMTLFVVGLLNMKRKLQAFVLMALIAFGTLTLAYYFSPNFQARVDAGRADAAKIVEQHNFCDSFGRRVAVWIIASEIVREHPLTGVGVSDAMSVMRTHIDKSHPNMQCVKDMPHFHNEIVQLAVQLGIPGVILYLLLFYTLLTMKIRQPEYRNLAIVFVMTYTIASMFETVFHEQFTLALFALFAGILLAVKRTEQEDAA